jgi:murein L,D-transpeptidase YafK
MRLLCYLCLAICLPVHNLFAPPPPSFAAQQLNSARVSQARNESEASLKKLFTDKGLSYPPKQIYWRVFKSEKTMELWAANQRNQAMTLVKSYPICAMSGELGPKRKQGDFQVPEGFYYIDHYNAYSAYHLSLRINYPNAADRAHQKGSMGGDIYIHGDCVSEGCMAMTTPRIKEIYWLSVQARNNGQEHVPVHIFPARLSNFKMNILRELYGEWEPNMCQFWENMQPGYRYFQQNHQIPPVSVGEKGKYIVQ